MYTISLIFCACVSAFRLRIRAHPIAIPTVMTSTVSMITETGVATRAQRLRTTSRRVQAIAMAASPPVTTVRYQNWPSSEASTVRTPEAPTSAFAIPRPLGLVPVTVR
jgi:hypothetical protein